MDIFKIQNTKYKKYKNIKNIKRVAIPEDGFDQISKNKI